MDSNRSAKYSSNKGIQKTSKDGYIDIALDNRSLKILCNMVLSRNKNVRRTQLTNIVKLLDLIDPSKYINDPDKMEMYSFIRKGVEARVGKNIDDPYLVIQYINGGVMSDDIVDIDKYKDIQNSEVDFMNNMISETLQYAAVYRSVDRIMDICTRFKTKEYGSKGEIVEEFKNGVNDVQNEFRRNRNEDHTEMMFSLRPGTFEDCITETYNRAANPRKKLSTGMQGMNEMLGGGFESGRVYMYFGLPGEGKSTVILNLIYQLKKYNRDYQCKDLTKKPCIVLLTMENSVEESIERLFGMATDHKKMTEFNLESVIDLLRNNGELTINTENPIDIIIKYKATNSVDTGYMYTLCDDLEDQGYEVIAFFQDYIGRIRSSQRLSDIRLEYGAVTDDFKVFANLKDIPVISVSQLNRDASKKIDDGRHTSKSDLIKLLGRSTISESMLILNNIDAGIMIAPEFTSTGEKYLGMQRIKIRYDAGDMNICYLPFSTNNNIKLMEDIGSAPLFKYSLRVDANMNIGSGPKIYNDIPEVDIIQTSTINKSIFTGSITSSDTSSLEAAFSLMNRVYNTNENNLPQAMLFYNETNSHGRKLIDPMEFDENSEYYIE